MNNNQNYLFLTNKDEERPIYRIMPVHRLFECFNDKKLVLVAPKMWDDPFENLLLNSRVQINGEQGTFAFHDKVYGQCWSFLEETDAMWRIYSPNKDGVKVKSTPKKLLEALMNDPASTSVPITDNTMGDSPDAAEDEIDPREYSKLKCFVGQVQYQGENALIATLETLGKNGLLSSDGSGIAQSLLYKRKEFEHEAEVRLIFSAEYASDKHSFEITPNDLFDEIIFDPRMSKSLYQVYESALKNFGHDKTKQSSLYKAPDQLVISLDEKSM